MRFADGVYHIAIGDSSQVREDNVNRVIALVLGSWPSSRSCSASSAG